MSNNEVVPKTVKMAATMKDQKKNKLNKVPGLPGLHDRIHSYLEKTKPNHPWLWTLYSQCGQVGGYTSKPRQIEPA